MIVPFFPWDWIRVVASVHDEATGTSSLKSFTVSQLVLDREGPDSYFAAYRRFSAVGGVSPPCMHLGVVDQEVFRVLRVYLTTGVVLFLFKDNLEYAADVYLMDRLRSKLRH